MATAAILYVACADNDAAERTATAVFGRCTEWARILRVAAADGTDGPPTSADRYAALAARRDEWKDASLVGLVDAARTHRRVDIRLLAAALDVAPVPELLILEAAPPPPSDGAVAAALRGLGLPPDPARRTAVATGDAWAASPRRMAAFLDFVARAQAAAAAASAPSITPWLWQHAVSPFFCTAAAHVDAASVLYVPRLLEGTYVSHGKKEDVAAVLAPAVTGGDAVTVGNARLGCDPAYYKAKTLHTRVVRADGAIVAEATKEGRVWQPPWAAWLPRERVAAAVAGDVSGVDGSRTLCVLAILKNEATVLGEWLRHYTWQGVQHFFLLDNGSTDTAALHAVIDAAGGPHVVTLVDAQRRYAQVEHYNTLRAAVSRYAWCLVVDVDEYVYARAAGDSLRRYVDSLPPERPSQVLLKWNMFGSSGHDAQPPSIRRGFTWRQYGEDPRPIANTKALVRTAALEELGIHDHRVRGATIVERHRLRINHYAIMSRAYFAAVKMSRGSVRVGYQDKFRDWAFFDRFDYRQEQDHELARLVEAAEPWTTTESGPVPGAAAESPSRRRRSVVTGGCGFIGRHLVAALAARGDDVLVIDIAADDPDAVAARTGGVEYAAIDIRETPLVAARLRAGDVVYHLAALPRVPFSISHPLPTHAVNVDGTLSLLEAARAAAAAATGGVSGIVFASSSSVYGGAVSDAAALCEADAPLPTSPYALQKFVGEQYLRLYAALYGVPSLCLRFFNVYGPGVAAACLAIPTLLAQHAAGKPLTLTGDGGQRRDFTHVDDVVRAVLAAGDRVLAAPATCRGQPLNVGSGVAASMRDIAAMIGPSDAVTYLPARIEPRFTLADTRRARDELGWAPQVELADGIRRLMRETS